jgi:cell division protein FtsB
MTAQGSAEGGSAVPNKVASKVENGRDFGGFFKRHMREILVVALLLLAVHDVFGEHGFLAMWRTQKQLTQLRGDIDRLNKENTKMTNQVTALKTDPETIERIAREQMGLAKPGELIFKLPAAAPGSGDSATPNANSDSHSH